MRLIDLLNNKPCCVRFTMITKQRYDCVQSITRFIQFSLATWHQFHSNTIRTQKYPRNWTPFIQNYYNLCYLIRVYKILISFFFFSFLFFLRIQFNLRTLRSHLDNNFSNPSLNQSFFSIIFEFVAWKFVA